MRKEALHKGVADVSASVDDGLLTGCEGEDTDSCSDTRHSTMEHSSHTTGSSGTMADMSPMGSTSGTSTSSGSADMMMMMQMWFYTSTKVTLWFKEWKIDSTLW